MMMKENHQSGPTLAAASLFRTDPRSDVKTAATAVVLFFSSQGFLAFLVAVYPFPFPFLSFSFPPASPSSFSRLLEDLTGAKETNLAATTCAGSSANGRRKK